MPDALSDALTRLLTGRERVPATLEQAWAEFGDTPAEQTQTSAVARLLAQESGISYRSARRSVERYRTSAGQHRTPRAGRLRAILEEARRRAGVTRNKADAVRRRGAVMALNAEIQVSSSWRRHQMPRTGTVSISGEDLGPAIDAWELGHLDDASAELLRAFFTVYWNNPAPLGEPARIRGIRDVLLA